MKRGKNQQKYPRAPLAAKAAAPRSLRIPSSDSQLEKLGKSWHGGKIRSASFVLWLLLTACLFCFDPKYELLFGYQSQLPPSPTGRLSCPCGCSLWINLVLWIPSLCPVSSGKLFPNCSIKNQQENKLLGRGAALGCSSWIQRWKNPTCSKQQRAGFALFSFQMKAGNDWIFPWELARQPWIPAAPRDAPTAPSLPKSCSQVTQQEILECPGFFWNPHGARTDSGITQHGDIGKVNSSLLSTAPALLPNSLQTGIFPAFPSLLPTLPDPALSPSHPEPSQGSSRFQSSSFFPGGHLITCTHPPAVTPYQLLEPLHSDLISNESSSDNKTPLPRIHIQGKASPALLPPQSRGVHVGLPLIYGMLQGFPCCPQDARLGKCLLFQAHPGRIHLHGTASPRQGQPGKLEASN